MVDQMSDGIYLVKHMKKLYLVYLVNGKDNKPFMVKHTQHGEARARRYAAYLGCTYKILEVLDSPEELYAHHLKWLAHFLKQGNLMGGISKAELKLVTKLYFGKKCKRKGNLKNLKPKTTKDEFSDIKPVEEFL